MNFFDSHCHIHTLKNPLSVCEEIKKNKIKVVNIFEAADNEKSSDLLPKLPTFELINYFLNNLLQDSFISFGVHPLNVENITLSETKERLKKACETYSEKLVAIGETGIDLFYGKNLEKQIEYFKLHCEIAHIYNKVVVIHARDINVETILDLIPKGLKFIFHCCTYDKDSCKKIVEKGGFISFSGILTFKNAEYLRDSAREVPIENVLLETDSPFLTPIPHRGKENKPEYVIEVYKCFSNIKNIPIEQTCRVLESNFKNLFLENLDKTQFY